MLPLAYMVRTETSNQGTFSLFQLGSFRCYMAELPWNDNIQQYSCIPEGSYNVTYEKGHRKFGNCFRVHDVSGRAGILIHTGNFSGDSRLGYKAHSHGCLLPATRIQVLGSQKSGVLSKPALSALILASNGSPFKLEIHNAFYSAVPTL